MKQGQPSHQDPYHHDQENLPISEDKKQERLYKYLKINLKLPLSRKPIRVSLTLYYLFLNLVG